MRDAYIPHARAKILSIDTSKARALPGVKAVIAGEDAPYLGLLLGSISGYRPWGGTISRRGHCSCCGGR